MTGADHVSNANSSFTRMHRYSALNGTVESGLMIRKKIQV